MFILVHADYIVTLHLPLSWSLTSAERLGGLIRLPIHLRDCQSYSEGIQYRSFRVALAAFADYARMHTIRQLAGNRSKIVTTYFFFFFLSSSRSVYFDPVVNRPSQDHPGGITFFFGRGKPITVIRRRTSLAWMKIVKFSESFRVEAEIHIRCWKFSQQLHTLQVLPRRGRIVVLFLSLSRRLGGTLPNFVNKEMLIRIRSASNRLVYCANRWHREDLGTFVFPITRRRCRLYCSVIIYYVCHLIPSRLVSGALNLALIFLWPCVNLTHYFIFYFIIYYFIALVLWNALTMEQSMYTVLLRTRGSEKGQKFSLQQSKVRPWGWETSLMYPPIT